MKTKSFLLAFAALAILCGMVGAQYDNSLSMVNLSVSPNPVMAGGNATIRFQLYNSYEDWLYGTSLQPSGSYPLLNVSPLSSNTVGRLDPGVNQNYYNYTIQIPNTTPSGVYTVNFAAKYFVYAAQGTETASTLMPVSFYVNNKPAIKVVASSPQPAALYSGYNQTMDLQIENTGYGTARNVSVTVRGEDGINILSSVSTFFISNLTQGSSVSEPLLISAQNIGQTGMIVSIAYYSSQLQQRFNSVQDINLSVAPSAQFTVGSANSGVNVGATDMPVHFEITNNGTSDARELELSLETTYPITPVASTAYISDLLPGASANLTFLVNVDTSGVPGNYPVTLFEQWKQPNGASNQQFSGSNNYFVSVVGSSSGVSRVEIGAVVVVIIIVAAVLLYRTRLSKKAKTSKKQSK
jgi:hypothetical protein